MNSIDRIVHAVRKNPEGLLLLGAGVALMLRSATDGLPRQDANVGASRRGVDERAVGAGEAVRAGTADVRDAVSGVARDIGNKATELGQATADGAIRAAIGARSSVENVVEAQPIAVAIAGLAVGCLAAAFLPASRLENEMIGPLGRKAADALSEAGDRVKEATLKAGEQLRDAASERGLSKSGLSEVARDVAQDFKSNVTGVKDGTRNGGAGRDVL